MSNAIFRFLGYYTDYEYKIQGMKDYKKAGNTACFSEALQKMRSNFETSEKFSGSYKIKIYRTQYQISKSKSNFCLLSKKEIRDYINILKKVVKFRWRFLKDNKDYFTVKVDIQEGYHTTHRAVLFWIRNLYEFPFNVLVKDAELFRKDHRYSYIGALNIHRLVYISNCLNEDCHSMFKYRYNSLGTLDEYQRAFNNDRELYVSDTIRDIANSIEIEGPIGTACSDLDKLRTLEFWTEPEDDCPQRKDRFEVYSKNLKHYTRKR